MGAAMVSRWIPRMILVLASALTAACCHLVSRPHNITVDHIPVSVMCPSGCSLSVPKDVEVDYDGNEHHVHWDLDSTTAKDWRFEVADGVEQIDPIEFQPDAGASSETRISLLD